MSQGQQDVIAVFDGQRSLHRVVAPWVGCIADALSGFSGGFANTRPTLNEFLYYMQGLIIQDPGTDSGINDPGTPPDRLSGPE